MNIVQVLSLLYIYTHNERGEPVSWLWDSLIVVSLLLTYTIELMFAELNREVYHEHSCNGQVEQCRHCVQPQHWRAEGERVMNHSLLKQGVDYRNCVCYYGAQVA